MRDDVDLGRAGDAASRRHADNAFAFALTIFFRRRFGGVTGDLLGATAKLAETAALATVFVSGT